MTTELVSSSPAPAASTKKDIILVSSSTCGYSQAALPSPQRVGSFSGSHPGLGLSVAVTSFKPQFKEDEVENAHVLWANAYPSLDAPLTTLEAAQEESGKATKVEAAQYQKVALETLFNLVQNPFEYGVWDLVLGICKSVSEDIRVNGVAACFTLSEVWQLAGAEVSLSPAWVDKSRMTGIHMKSRMYGIALRQLGAIFQRHHEKMVAGECEAGDVLKIPELVAVNRKANDVLVMQCRANENPVSAPIAYPRPEQMLLERSPSPVQDAIDRQRPRQRSGSDLVYATTLVPLAALWVCSPFGVFVGSIFAISSIWKVKQLTQKTCDVAAKAVIMVNERTNAATEKALGVVKDATDKAVLAMKEAGDKTADTLKQAATDLGNKVQTVAADTTETVKRAANAHVMSVVVNRVTGSVDWSIVMAGIGILGFIASYVMRKPSRIRDMEAVKKHVKRNDGKESITAQLTTLLEPVLMDKHEYSTIRSATDVLSTMFLLPLLYVKGPKFAFQMGQMITGSVRMLLNTWQLVSLVRGWFSNDESPADVVEANVEAIADRISVMTDPVLAAREEAELNAALVLNPKDERAKRDLVKLKAARDAPPVQIDKGNQFWEWARENRVLAASFIMGIIAIFAGAAYMFYQRRKKTLSTHIFKVGEKLVMVNDKGQALEASIGRVRIYQKQLQESFPLAAFRVGGRCEGKKKYYVSKNKKSGRWVVYDDKGRYIDYIDAFDNTDDELVFEDREDLLEVERYMNANGHALGDNTGYDGDDYADWTRETTNLGDSMSFNDRMRAYGDSWRPNELEATSKVPVYFSTVSQPVAQPVAERFKITTPPKLYSQLVAPPAKLVESVKWPPAPARAPASKPAEVISKKAIENLVIAAAKATVVLPKRTPPVKPVVKPVVVKPVVQAPQPRATYWLNRKMTSDCSFGAKCAVPNCQFVHPAEDRCYKPWCGCPQPHPFTFKARCDKAGCDQTCGLFHRKDKVVVPKQKTTESLNGLVPVTDSKLAKSLGSLQAKAADGVVQGQAFTLANRVWTAKHCLSDGKHTSQVSYKDGVEMPLAANVWKACDGFDIAYTELKIADRPSLSVGKEPVVGNSVHMRVFDYNKKEWVTATGVISSLDSTFLHYTIPTDEGYSGGAVLDQSGNIIAMHTNGAAVRNGPNQGLRITPALVAFLTKSKN